MERWIGIEMGTRREIGIEIEMRIEMEIRIYRDRWIEMEMYCTLY